MTIATLEDAGAWLTPAETARALDLTPQRIAQLARAGRLDGISTPLGRLFRAEAIRELARERAQRRKG